VDANAALVDLHETVGKVRTSIGALNSAPLLDGWQETLQLPNLVTRCQIFRPKCTKFDFGCAAPLDGFKVSNFRGIKEGRGTEREGER